MIVQSDSTNFHLFLLLLSSHTNCGSLFLVYLCEFCSVGADFEWIWMPVMSSSNPALQFPFSDVFFLSFITPKFDVSIWRLSNYLHFSHFFSASFDVSGLIFCAIERSILPRHFPLLFVLFWQLDHEFHLFKVPSLFFSEAHTFSYELFSSSLSCSRCACFQCLDGFSMVCLGCPCQTSRCLCSTFLTMLFFGLFVPHPSVWLLVFSTPLFVVSSLLLRSLEAFLPSVTGFLSVSFHNKLVSIV